MILGFLTDVDAAAEFLAAGSTRQSVRTQDPFARQATAAHESTIPQQLEELKMSPLTLVSDLFATPFLYPIVLLVLLVSYVLRQRSFHPLASIPGPFWAGLSRLWLTKHSWDGDMHTTMIELHDRHGALVRTGPDEVSVADLTAIKTIYGAGTKFRKSNWYSVWQVCLSAVRVNGSSMWCMTNANW